jgi:hypothetical protein
VAGLVIAYGAFSVMGNRLYRRGSEAAHRVEKIAYLVGALLLSLSFIVSIVGVRTRSTSGGTTPSPAASATP